MSPNSKVRLRRASARREQVALVQIILPSSSVSSNTSTIAEHGLSRRTAARQPNMPVTNAEMEFLARVEQTGPMLAASEGMLLMRR
eukprot:scaffold118724_cov63-Phaeocystis_antarctica.AAC.4